MKEEKDWQALLAELNLVQPDQRRVRQLMTQFGLPYTSDPLEQMSRCLLHFDHIQDQFPNHKPVKDPSVDL